VKTIEVWCCQSRLSRRRWIFELELVETHGQAELLAAELFDLFQLYIIGQLNGTSIKKLQEFSDNSDAEIWNHNGDELLQTGVDVHDSLLEDRAAAAEPDLVSLNGAVAALEDEVGVKNRFSVRG